MGGGAFAEDTAPGGAYAQKSDVKVSIGLKAWNNTWESGTPLHDGGMGSFTAGEQLSLVPSIGIRWKDFLVSASYFNKTSYSFTDYRDKVTFDNGTFSEIISTKADRDEYDINIGYFVLPGVAVSLGYKEVKQKYHIIFTGDAGPFDVGTQTTTLSTPTLGIQASSKIGDTPFFMYGSGAMSIGDSLKAEFENGSSVTGWYSAAELGLGYAFPSGIVFTLGVKSQFMDVKMDTSGLTQRARDITSGLIAGIAYTF